MTSEHSPASEKTRRILVIIRKIIVRTLLGIILLFLIVVGLIQIPSVQNYIKGKVVNSLAQKLHTTVKLGYIKINFAGSVVLEDFFLADRQHDTIINARKLKVSLNPLGLLHKQITISGFLLSGARFNYQILDSEGRTNLDFIINSFSSGDKKDKKKEPGAWDIQVKKVELDKSRFVYDNLSDSLSFDLRVGLLKVNIDNNNLDSLIFNIDRILLEKTQVYLTSYGFIRKVVENAKQSKAKAAKNEETPAIRVTLRKLDLNSITFVQADSLSRAGGTYFIGEAQINPKNIDVANQLIEISSIKVAKSTVKYDGGKVVKVPEVEKEKDIDGLKESWKIKLGAANLQFNHIQLLNVVPPQEGSPEFLSDFSLSNFVAKLSMEFNNSQSWNFDVSDFHFEDDRTSTLVSLVANAQSDNRIMSVSPFRLNLGSSHITGSVSGNFASGTKGSIPDFTARISSSDLKIKDFMPYIPKKIYPNLKRIPSHMSIVADMKSEQQLLNGKGELVSNEGTIGFSVEMGKDRNAPYVAIVNLKNIDAGFFAQNPKLGRVTAMLNANGVGFSPDSMKTTFNLVLPSITYDSVQYDDVRINGNIDHGAIVANVISNDPVAKVQVHVDGRKSGDAMMFRVNSHIQHLDLHAMRMMSDTIVFSGIVDATYSSEAKNRFKAKTDTLIITAQSPRDKIKTSADIFYNVLGDTVEASVNTEFGNVKYDGNLPLQELAPVMKNYFAQYFSADKADSAQNSNKFFKVAIKIKDLSMLNYITSMKIDIPDDANIKAELKDNHLTANVNIDKIILKDMEIDKLTLDAVGRDSAFLIDFKTDALHNKLQSLRNISFNSKLRQGLLNSRLQLSNAASQKWFNIGVELEPKNPKLNLVIKEPLLLNHQNWDVDNRNRTFIQNKNVVFSNVKLQNGEKLISLLSDDKRPEKLAVSFKNLDLALLSEFMNNDTTYLSGNIDGSLMATDLFARPVPVFDAKLDITNIVLEKRPLGDLKVIASNVENNDVAKVNVDFGLENMKFNLNGTYGIAKNIPMDLNLSSQNLSLEAIQPLMKKIISDAGGFVNASLNLKGTFNAPVVTGDIGFDKATAFIEPIQSKFAIDNQKILFRGNSVDFNHFTILDDDGQKLDINGKVALESLKNFNYNLNIKSDKFLAYQGPPDNIPGQDNNVIITTDIKVTGENQNPNVSADVKIDEGSKFFYKITKHKTNLTEEGVIEFVNADSKDGGKAPLQPSIIDNMNLTANISLANNTAVTIITDPVRNLGLHMKSGGTFSLSQRPFQSPRLTGRLDISGGDYTISLSGLKRKFQIADSSYIIWYGNISEPELSLRAYYQVRTSPAELTGNKEDNGTLPFLVNMIIAGSLEDPRFNFRITLPAEYADETVAAKLQEINSNESDLNQKAMALLLFGSFGFNNFANVLSSGGGANVLISNALNQFASQKLKFVDLHFDLESYDNYGGTSQDNLRTEMKIAASKKFDNDRLNVQLGSTFVLQADEQEQQKSLSEKISPEFNIEYLLNKPRTLSVSAFRRSEYRGLIEGKVISTGAGIIFQKDFNTLKDFFAKKPEQPEPVAEVQNNVDE